MAAMTMAERVRRLSVHATEAEACRARAEAATNFDVADQEWEAMNAEVDSILWLLSGPEAVAHLTQLQRLAAMQDQVDTVAIGPWRGPNSVPFYGNYAHPGDVA